VAPALLVERLAVEPGPRRAVLAWLSRCPSLGRLCWLPKEAQAQEGPSDGIPRRRLQSRRQDAGSGHVRGDNPARGHDGTPGCWEAPLKGWKGAAPRPGRALQGQYHHWRLAGTRMKRIRVRWRGRTAPQELRLFPGRRGPHRGTEVLYRLAPVGPSISSTCRPTETHTHRPTDGWAGLV
jgi:hypothetical protein